jgi:hypothetical protein
LGARTVGRAEPTGAHGYAAGSPRGTARHAAALADLSSAIAHVDLTPTEVLRGRSERCVRPVVKEAHNCERRSLFCHPARPPTGGKHRDRRRYSALPQVEIDSGYSG